MSTTLYKGQVDLSSTILADDNGDCSYNHPNGSSCKLDSTGKCNCLKFADLTRYCNTVF